MDDKTEQLRAPHDGRNIDPAAGRLEGEASQQRVREIDVAYPGRRQLAEVPSRAEGPSYYGQPLLKEPVWIWSIPAYFYVGGVAGACNLLSAVAQAVDGEAFESLTFRARWIGAVGDAVSAGLLVHDLGRPTRFLNMLRVFRPTSPMSIGSWILAICGAFSGASALLARRRGVLGRVGDLSSFGAALWGVPLAGYTGVLIANSAVPLWQAAGWSLPALFMSSATASAGSLLELTGLEGRSATLASRFAVAGKVGELAWSRVVERRAGRVARVGRPLQQGMSGTLWKAARVFTASSLALSLLLPRALWSRVLAGALATAGALSLRYGVFHAGKASARDPLASFEQQRPPTPEIAAPKPRPPAPVGVTEAAQSPAL